MKPYLLGESSITSNKSLMVFTGTDPEYSKEDYLNAVTANQFLNIGPEPINTPLHQNWIHKRTTSIQSTVDGAAQKWLKFLVIEFKSDWKNFSQEFFKQVQCSARKKTNNIEMKQRNTNFETLVRKSNSPNTHDYKIMKMTEILMMTLTQQ